MIIDADLTIRCDICKDEMAWIAVTVQGYPTRQRVNIELVKDGWAVTELGLHVCQRCRG